MEVAWLKGPTHTHTHTCTHTPPRSTGDATEKRWGFQMLLLCVNGQVRDPAEEWRRANEMAKPCHPSVQRVVQRDGHGMCHDASKQRPPIVYLCNHDCRWVTTFMGCRTKCGLCE